MTTTPDPADRSAWHKRFAMDGNNRAWALAVQTRTPAEDREMLDAAHSAAWHWAAIGTELQRMRATMLLAQVHALLGHGAAALAYAQEMRDFFLAQPDTHDWELAFTHTIVAHAAFAAGQRELHGESFKAARNAIGQIKDAEDAAIVQQTFKLVPMPQEGVQQ